MNAHVVFFGDGERTFALTPELIVELERKTGAGIGSICKRVFAGHFAHADLVETIRLALVGGGASPAEAASLTDAYAVKRPFAEIFPLAVAVLETAWFGSVTTPESIDEQA